MKMTIKRSILFLLIAASASLFGFDWPDVIKSGYEKEMYFLKQQELLQPLVFETERPIPRDAIMSGNQIRTLVFDYGSIGHPSREPSMEWPIYSAHGYAFEFGPLVGVEVPVDSNGYYLHEAYTGPEGQKSIDPETEGYKETQVIVCDGLLSGGMVLGREVDGDNNRWGWEPLPDYANSESVSIPLSHKPETWNPAWGDNWPGTYKAGVSTADQAIYYEMDDRYNTEFIESFKPFKPGDVPDGDPRLEYGGAGLHVTVRAYQWSNPEARNCIFFVYEIENKSMNDYEKVVFGMFGDPHIGGTNDFSDDMAYFDNELNMVYGYDGDNKGDWGGSTGWLGYTFLESPGNPYDGIDNDGDGMVDESMQDGIDNDGDWDPEIHDVGQDGLGPMDPGYPGPDLGEGDGVPTAGDPNDPTKPGEPNFDKTDLDEADQIGLTSFDAYQYGADAIKYDVNMWNRMKPEVPLTEENTDIQQRVDNIFIYGSGYFPLKAGDKQRFSIALLMGVDKRDLYESAKTVQNIYDNGYQFAVAPNKPKLTVVPGDKKVHLYWDDNAERSFDPLFGYDFQGYAIYRATDPGFNECLTITNTYGVPTLHQPIAKFDKIDEISGPAVVGNGGVHYDLGSDNGLVHEYVDEDLVNGVTYYYAVCSYDIGDTSGVFNLTPTECTKIIDQDAYTKEITVDDNTGFATPRKSSPGLTPPEFFNGEIDRSACRFGTGDIDIDFVDMAAVKDGNEYELYFEKTGAGGSTQFSVMDKSTLYYDTLLVEGTSWLQMNKTKVANVRAYKLNGDPISPTMYTVDPAIGRIMFDASLLNEELVLAFNYHPLYRSSYLNNEDATNVFDGMKLYIEDVDSARRDPARSGWLDSPTTLRSGVTQEVDTLFNDCHDYMLVWNNDYESTPTAFNQYAPFKVFDITADSAEMPIYLSPTESGHYYINSDILVLSEAVASYDYALWRLWFDPPPVGETVWPQDGDIYRIMMARPFNVLDTVRFKTKEAQYDPGIVENPLDQIHVVPNPYCAQAIWEPTSGYAAGRGERRIYFNSLPPVCTIKIYTVSGEHVRTIEHNDGGDVNASMFNGSETYDLLNKDNSEIAYGVYLWHVDARASGLGTKTGKFAVIK